MNKIIEEVKIKNWIEVKRLLKEDPSLIRSTTEDGISIPLLVSSMGDFEFLKYMTENTLSRLEEKDSEGRTCLHYAAQCGNLECVRYLVEQVGFSLVEADYHGVTSYDIIMKQNSKELCDYTVVVTGMYPDRIYHNPIRTGMFPDPSIIRVGDDYYMVNSTFIFFPCIPVSHSKDLIHWNIIGHAITNKEWAGLDNLEGGRGYWAPDISYHNGRFYITATLRHNDGGEILRQQMVVSSDKPEGPYNEPAIIDEDGIDPSIFTDEDGRRYMLLNRGARIFEISEDGRTKISEPKLLYYGDNKHATEGPHLLKKDGWYYLFLAEGGTGRGHQINVARSKALYGPYEACPFNPIMTQKDSNALLQCCGHGKPVKTAEEDWYMVYLSYRFLDGKYGILGRETSMDPITWTLDGWPMVNGLKGPSCVQKVPTTGYYIPEEKENVWLDEFKSKELDISYIHPRAPEENAIQLDQGKLVIRGSKKELNTMDARNMVLRRQMDFDFSSEICMIVPKLKLGQNAGLLAYYDENTFLKFGLFANQKNTNNNNANNECSIELAIYEKIGDIEILHSMETMVSKEESSTFTLENVDKIELKMDVCGFIRKFYYKIGDQWKLFGVLDQVTYLCSEGIQKGKRFTGATLGMYGVGGEHEPLFVSFERFKYSGLLK